MVDDTTNYIVADLINRYTTVNTMVPDIDQYYFTCFEGKVNVVAFKFIQDAVCGYALIIQGIYPIHVPIGIPACMRHGYCDG